METHHTDCRKGTNGVNVVDLIHCTMVNGKEFQERKSMSTILQSLGRRSIIKSSFPWGKFEKRSPVKCCDDHSLLMMTVGGGENAKMAQSGGRRSRWSVRSE